MLCTFTSVRSPNHLVRLLSAGRRPQAGDHLPAWTSLTLSALSPCLCCLECNGLCGLLLLAHCLGLLSPEWDLLVPL
ncbi:unnamed protein product [Linum trigynum]|uniref:Uncharacterized protein n=1 Tax=Linum trigynum TaxID=586398 RepID=A0AAV2F6Q4_9ROSI